MFLRHKILQNILLAVIGLSAGEIISAGVFAFLAIIGVFPRIIGKMHMAKKIMLFETIIILGGICGNLVDIFKIQIGMKSNLFLIAAGLFYGIFVGCLFMSLAETLKALPVFTRRIKMAVGLQYLILMIAIGKTIGSLLFYFLRIGMKS